MRTHEKARETSPKGLDKHNIHSGETKPTDSIGPSRHRKFTLAQGINQTHLDLAQLLDGLLLSGFEGHGICLQGLLLLHGSLPPALKVKARIGICIQVQVHLHLFAHFLT
jgi:hypothetical protein